MGRPVHPCEAETSPELGGWSSALEAVKRDVEAISSEALDVGGDLGGSDGAAQRVKAQVRYPGQRHERGVRVGARDATVSPVACAELREIGGT
jgi:hypothetical protein